MRYVHNQNSMTSIFTVDNCPNETNVAVLSPGKDVCSEQINIHPIQCNWCNSDGRGSLLNINSSHGNCISMLLKTQRRDVYNIVGFI
jgi:hypothetical protein